MLSMLTLVFEANKIIYILKLASNTQFSWVIQVHLADTVAPGF